MRPYCRRLQPAPFTGQYQQWDVGQATFKPAERESVRDRCLPLIGQRTRWMLGWWVEDGPWRGQGAWIPQPQTPEEMICWASCGWAPTEDLADVVLVECISPH